MFAGQGDGGGGGEGGSVLRHQKVRGEVAYTCNSTYNPVFIYGYIYLFIFILSTIKWVLAINLV